MVVAAGKVEEGIPSQCAPAKAKEEAGEAVTSA